MAAAAQGPVGPNCSAQLQLARRTGLAAPRPSARSALDSLSSRPESVPAPQPHRVRHELRPPALATPDRRLGELPIASSTRAPRSRAGPMKCIAGMPSAASSATTTDRPLNAVPSPLDCRTAWEPVKAEGQGRRLPW